MDVKINIKIAAFVLTIATGFIVISGSIQPEQANPNPEKSVLIFPEKNNIYIQEKERYQYIGMEKCASVCHNNEEMGFQYNIVKSSPHANAFINLVSKKARRYAINAKVKEDPQVSQVCLKCHVTGGGLDSSSFTATYRKEDGVTCEACHKGEFISKTFLPEETDCLKCHNNSVHKIHKFEFKADCARISHPRPKAKPKDS